MLKNLIKKIKHFLKIKIKKIIRAKNEMKKSKLERQ